MRSSCCPVLIKVLHVVCETGKAATIYTSGNRCQFVIEESRTKASCSSPYFSTERPHRGAMVKMASSAPAKDDISELSHHHLTFSATPSSTLCLQCQVTSRFHQTLRQHYCVHNCLLLSLRAPGQSPAPLRHSPWHSRLPIQVINPNFATSS